MSLSLNRFYAFKRLVLKCVNVNDLHLPYVVSIDFWQYKIEVKEKIL